MVNGEGGRRPAVARTFLLAALTAAGLCLGYGQEQAGPPAGGVEARAAVEANHRKFTGAFAARDAVAAAALHAPDARLLPELGGPVEGAQAVEAFWRGAMESGVRLVQLQTLSVEERGELAYETGDYMVTVPAGPGVTDVRSGNYLVVWRRSGGGWLVAAAIWNAGKGGQGR
jgi:ketosteroid isomerase-like protein